MTVKTNGHLSKTVSTNEPGAPSELAPVQHGCSSRLCLSHKMLKQRNIMKMLLFVKDLGHKYVEATDSFKSKGFIFLEHFILVKKAKFSN